MMFGNIDLGDIDLEIHINDNKIENKLEQKQIEETEIDEIFLKHLHEEQARLEAELKENELKYMERAKIIEERGKIIETDHKHFPEMIEKAQERANSTPPYYCPCRWWW